AGEGGVREPVEGACGLGKEAARVLVLALRAALEERDAALDAELDRLVVARLEVQARHVLDRAPVAAIERVRPEEVEGGGDGTPLVLGDDEQHVLRHAAREQREEFAVEVRRRMMLAIGAPIAFYKEIPVGLLRFRAAEAAQHDPRFGDAAPLLADLLALVVGERGEEILEVAIAGIAPVELHAG